MVSFTSSSSVDHSVVVTLASECFLPYIWCLFSRVRWDLFSISEAGRGGAPAATSGDADRSLSEAFIGSHFRGASLAA